MSHYSSIAMNCRAAQKEALNAFLAGPVCAPSVAVHGASGSGKSTTIGELVSQLPYTCTWVTCDQCPTARVLLQRALRGIFVSTKTGLPEEASCENVDIFINLVAQKFRQAKFTDRHVLVLDRIDKLPDFRALTELLNGFTRIPELTHGLTNLVVVFVYSTAEPKVLVSNPAVPRVWFPRYTYEEAVAILQQEPLTGAPSDNFKYEFLELVVNALRPTLGSDLGALRRAAHKIWPRFVEGCEPSDSVAKIYVKRPYLFQAEFIVDKLEVSQPPAGPSSQKGNSGQTATSVIGGYLLCAAYLASYNPPRYDMRYFSLAKTMRNRRRETKPKKNATIPARSLAAPAFEMERMLAIFHAIHPRALDYHSNVSVGRELATLASQNLLTKSQADILDTRTKWKINAPWAYVQIVASEIGFEIEEYLMEA